jgi:spore germination protein GerM
VPEGLGASSTSETTVPPIEADAGIDLSQPAELWFIRADKLVPVDRRVPIGTTPSDLMEDLVNGPTTEERNQSLRSALLDLQLYKSARPSSGGVVTVDLTPAFSGLPSSEQLLAVGQIVGSLTSLPGVGLVSFRLDGEQRDVPVGDGSQSQGPVSRDDYASLCVDRSCQALGR